MHSKSILSFFLLVSTALIATAAIADDSGIDTVVVTATRTAEPRERTGESVSVITGDDLQKQQTVVLTDALAETPALTVNRNGPLGQLTTIGIRGGETGQTLVLIDGVRINDPSSTDEGAVLGDLLVNNVDRVEILRGPQSTLYGSDAIGGVINVLTRRGGNTPLQIRASAEGGSFDTYRINAAANGTADDVEYGAAANYFHSNGISAAANYPETDGYGNFGLTGNVRVHVSDQLSVDLRSYYTSGRDDFDDGAASFSPPYPPADSAAYNTNRLFAGYAGVNLDLFDGMFHNRFAVMGSKSNREFFDSAFDTIHENALNEGSALRFEYQGVVDLSPNDQLSFGIEHQRLDFTGDFFDSFAFFASSSKGHSQITGYYAQGQSTFFNVLTLTGGVRYDDDAEFGSHTSVKLAGAWQVMDGTTLRANYGDGFKAPTLYEQFSQYSSPNGALAPETAKGWEAGADQRLLDNRMRASLTYFERRTTNLIDFQSCFVASPPAGCATRPSGFYFNIGRTQSKGVEAEIESAITDTLNASFNYTDMTATDLATGLSLQRRPHIQANAILTFTPVENWSLGESVSYVGHRIDQYDTSTTPPTPFPNGSYTLVNVFSQYDFGQSDLGTWQLYGRVENLFDEHYQPELGYGAAGRAFYAGVRVSY